MRSSAGPNFGLILTVLVFAGIAGAAFPLLASEGFVVQRFSLDFQHITLWVVAGAALLMLSRVAAIACKAIASREASEASQEEDAEDWLYESEDADESEAAEESGAEAEQTRGAASSPLLTAAAIAEGVLLGLGWATLLAAFFTAIASLSTALLARPSPPDPESLDKYLGVFGSLARWVIAAGLFYGILRAVRVMWPAGSDAIPFPWRQLMVLAAAYLLLANDGLVRVAFEFPGGLILIILVLALALPYAASVMRRISAMSLPVGLQIPARILLLLTDIGWIVLVLGIMLSLPRMVNGVPELQEGGALESVAPYLGILNTLAMWSIILLGPFIIVRAIAAFRPAVGEVFGFPMGRILLFALALIGFSDSGVPATASSFPIPKLMPAMAAALFISYLSLILKRVAQLGLPPRVAVPMTNIPPLVGALMPAISVSLVVWALLLSLPLISAPLLDHSRTSALGESSLPYFASFFEVRFPLTAFVFVAVLTLALPDPLWTPARLRVRPMVAAVGFAASGCLLWLSMAPLSGLGHVFPLFGAILGAGLLTLSMSQLAAYYAAASDQMVSAAARWLVNSRVRGFLIGASIAFYGMLLRPLLYETLWFAAVYEWIVVFSVAVWAMFKIRGSLKTFVETAEAAPLNWTAWSRHELQLEDRPDPRRILVARWQRQFVQSGEWISLWTYLMGLLCRNNASPESVQSVFRPLRESVAAPTRRSFWNRGRDKDDRRRELGLAASLRSAEQALSVPSGLPANIDATSLRETAGKFIENGSDSEAVAARVISAYRGRGADTNNSVNLWFPLVNVVEVPTGWFTAPWTRRRIRARAQERRSRLVEGAITHLSGETALASLSVGVAARRAPLSPITPNRSQTESSPLASSNPVQTDESGSTTPVANASAPEQNPTLSPWVRHQMQRASTQAAAQGATASPRLDALAPGQGFELLNETEHSYLVRTSENVIGYVSKTALVRLPILPGDEVIEV